jgi:hypothetical protein
MEKPTLEKPCRLEVNNPLRTTGWQPLWAFDGDQLAAYQELRDELNKINAPVQLRIVPDTGQLSRVSSDVRDIKVCL